MKNTIKYLSLTIIAVFAWSSIEAQSMRVMSYNTRMSGEMVDYTVKPFASFIRKHNPDFVMLQEVDFNTTRNGKQDFTTQLAAELGMFSVFGKAIDYGGGEYGVAILSKYPILSSNNSPFTEISGAKEVRTLLYIDVQLPETGETIRIACTHLDHSTDEIRTAMVAQINAKIGDAKIPTVLAGDFNARPDQNAIVNGMANWQRVCNDTPTYPSSGATIKIDYMYALPKGKTSVKSYETIVNTNLSDHNAMLADIEFNK